MLTREQKTAILLAKISITLDAIARADARRAAVRKVHDEICARVAAENYSPADLAWFGLSNARFS